MIILEKILGMTNIVNAGIYPYILAPVAVILEALLLMLPALFFNKYLPELVGKDRKKEKCYESTNG